MGKPRRDRSRGHGWAECGLTALADAAVGYGYAATLFVNENAEARSLCLLDLLRPAPNRHAAGARFEACLRGRSSCRQAVSCGRPPTRTRRRCTSAWVRPPASICGSHSPGQQPLVKNIKAEGRMWTDEDGKLPPVRDCERTPGLLEEGLRLQLLRAEAIDIKVQDTRMAVRRSPAAAAALAGAQVAGGHPEVGAAAARSAASRVLAKRQHRRHRSDRRLEPVGKVLPGGGGHRTEAARLGLRHGAGDMLTKAFPNEIVAGSVGKDKKPTTPELAKAWRRPTCTSTARGRASPPRPTPWPFTRRPASPSASSGDQQRPDLRVRHGPRPGGRQHPHSIRERALKLPATHLSDHLRVHHRQSRVLLRRTPSPAMILKNQVMALELLDAQLGMNSATTRRATSGWPSTSSRRGSSSASSCASATRPTTPQDQRPRRPPEGRHQRQDHREGPRQARP